MNSTSCIISDRSKRLFWSKVNVGDSNECWPWLDYLDKDGYGRPRLDGVRIRSNRAAYIIANGDIPEGLCACHTCDNPKCCNPKHLFLGTSAENTEDSTVKGRRASGDRHGSKIHPESIQRGALNRKAKLTEQDVLVIRNRFAAGGVTKKKLAEEFNVLQSAIGKIIKGTAWRHILPTA